MLRLIYENSYSYVSSTVFLGRNRFLRKVLTSAKYVTKKCFVMYLRHETLIQYHEPFKRPTGLKTYLCYRKRKASEKFFNILCISCRGNMGPNELKTIIVIFLFGFYFNAWYLSFISDTNEWYIKVYFTNQIHQLLFMLPQLFYRAHHGFIYLLKLIDRFWNNLFKLVSVPEKRESSVLL